MLKWLRSVEMEYLTISFHENLGRKLIKELGKLKLLQFTDVKERHNIYS